MRPLFLTLNVLLAALMLLFAVTWHSANNHLPLLEWRALLGTPVPFLLLLLSLPFVPYRGTKQLWLAFQALSVGVLLALSWLMHMSESASITLGAGSLLLVVAFLTMNLKNSIASHVVSRAAVYAPSIVALVFALLVLVNETSRPIDGDSFKKLLEAHEQSIKSDDSARSLETTELIKEAVVSGMVAKGYSAAYSHDIARDTPLEYLVPLATDWKLVDR